MNETRQLTLPERLVLLTSCAEEGLIRRDNAVTAAALLDLFEGGWLGVEVPNDRAVMFRQHGHPNKVTNRILFTIADNSPRHIREWMDHFTRFEYFRIYERDLFHKGYYEENKHNEEDEAYDNELRTVLDDLNPNKVDPVGSWIREAPSSSLHQQQEIQQPREYPPEPRLILSDLGKKARADVAKEILFHLRQVDLTPSVEIPGQDVNPRPQSTQIQQQKKGGKPTTKGTTEPDKPTKAAVQQDDKEKKGAVGAKGKKETAASTTQQQQIQSQQQVIIPPPKEFPPPDPSTLLIAQPLPPGSGPQPSDQLAFEVAQLLPNSAQLAVPPQIDSPSQIDDHQSILFQGAQTLDPNKRVITRASSQSLTLLFRILNAFGLTHLVFHYSDPIVYKKRFTFLLNDPHALPSQPPTDYLFIKPQLPKLKKKLGDEEEKEINEVQQIQTQNSEQIPQTILPAAPIMTAAKQPTIAEKDQSVQEAGKKGVSKVAPKATAIKAEVTVTKTEITPQAAPKKSAQKKGIEIGADSQMGDLDGIDNQLDPYNGECYLHHIWNYFQKALRPFPTIEYFTELLN
ncbi:MAG: hypothetical protein EZS28_007830 [Streblomastix strix]|uniref:Uncharacterized protein n=1 Tax=Streblomastix strix TaxID=222440 RepID=A0A5J4WNV9_9EUKA|nr:MAG: hypothetical protein EZS28_007830 [Streblomastix strix]